MRADSCIQQTSDRSSLEGIGERCLPQRNDSNRGVEFFSQNELTRCSRGHKIAAFDWVRKNTLYGLPEHRKAQGF